MKIDIAKLLAEANSKDDVIAAEYKGAYIFVTNSEKSAQVIRDAVNDEGEEVKGEKV